MDKRLFALFGNPVSHSKSPLLHNSLYRQLGLDACYTRYLLHDGRLLAEKFLSLGLSGINITVPFKEDAFDACDFLDEFAKNIGAVNTIILKDGKLHGYNTDAPGFMASLGALDPKSAVILGAGGTARAIAFALRANGIEPLILNRSAGRLEFFKQHGFSTSTLDGDIDKEFDLVVNTTSAGLTDDELPMQKDMLRKLLSKTKLAYDCIYKETPFLKLAAELHVDRRNGLDMLIWQAFFAFEIFVDKKIDRKYIEVMRNAVN